MPNGAKRNPLIAVDSNVLLDREKNDSLIVAETGLIGATLLVSSDAHLKDLNYARLKLVLDAADVATPLVASPFKIVNQFF